MDQDQLKTNTQISEQKKTQEALDARAKIKTGFYTLIIFAIVVFIWVSTNPFFNKNKNDVTNSKPMVNQSTKNRIESIGQSFNTMWSDVSGGFSNLKK